jgi:hypothetical protein
MSNRRTTRSPTEHSRRIEYDGNTRASQRARIDNGSASRRAVTSQSSTSYARRTEQTTPYAYTSSSRTQRTQRRTGGKGREMGQVEVLQEEAAVSRLPGAWPEDQSTTPGQTSMPTRTNNRPSSRYQTRATSSSMHDAGHANQSTSTIRTPSFRESRERERDKDRNAKSYVMAHIAHRLADGPEYEHSVTSGERGDMQDQYGFGSSSSSTTAAPSRISFTIPSLSTFGRGNMGLISASVYPHGQPSLTSFAGTSRYDQHTTPIDEAYDAPPSQSLTFDASTQQPRSGLHSQVSDPLERLGFRHFNRNTDEEMQLARRQFGVIDDDIEHWIHSVDESPTPTFATEMNTAISDVFSRYNHQVDLSPRPRTLESPVSPIRSSPDPERRYERERAATIEAAREIADQEINITDEELRNMPPEIQDEILAMRLQREEYLEAQRQRDHRNEVLRQLLVRC